MFITIIAFFVVLSVLVLIHELGHFLMAKKFGIKVEEFGFGFPPRIFGKKIGETIYSINLLPIGGFVKLYGEDAAGGGSLKSKKTNKKTDIKRAFFARPAWQRAVIVLAGVVMNFVLAVVLISYLFSAHGVAVPTKNIRVVDVTQNSPAKLAGIKAGDQILRVNGKEVTDTSKFVALTRQKEGQPMELVVKRGDSEFSVKVTPRKTFPKGEGPLGVSINNVEIKKTPWYQAPFVGTLEAVKFSWMILSGLGQMVVELVTTGQKPSGVAGPIGVAQLTGQAVSYGYVATLWFVAVLSLNLAVVNLLPIPALDGGRLFFIIIEMVTGKKVNSRYETIAHAIGLAVLLSLILLITLFDVLRLLSGESIVPKM